MNLLNDLIGDRRRKVGRMERIVRIRVKEKEEEKEKSCKKEKMKKDE